jgi:hypothetical protein
MRQVTVLKFLVSLGLSGLVLTLGECGGSSSSSQAPRLRVMHAMPSVFVTVDVVQDNSSTLFAQNLSYGSSTGYLGTTAASHTITVEPSGSNNPLVITNFTAAAGASYTLIASGPSGSLSGQLLTDNLAAPPSGDFKLRVVDASPSGGSEDIYITAPGADLNTATPNVANMGFPAASTYLNLVGGNYEIRITAAGTKSVEFDSSTVTFSAGQVRTAVVLDAPGGGSPLNVAVLADVN